MPRRARPSESIDMRSYYDVVISRLGSLRIQDLVLVIVSALAVYLLRARDSYMLTPAWHISQSTRLSDEMIERRSVSSVPRPVITDLDDDGRVEIVMITKRLELTVYDVPLVERDTSSERRLSDLSVRASVNVLSFINKGMTQPSDSQLLPVAMETGYLDKPMEDRNRSQVIVVMLSDWSVLCFDRALTLLWQHRSLLNSVMSDVWRSGRGLNSTPEARESSVLSNELEVKSVGLLIVPHSIQRDQIGTVVVGGSMVHRGHNTRNKKLSSVDGVPHDTAHESHTATHTDESYTHFSTLAFGGSDGTIQWRHFPQDFLKVNKKEDEPIHWKLSLKRHSSEWQQHVSEVHWTKYLRLITRLLPYSWSEGSDTRFELSDVHGTTSQHTHTSAAYSSSGPASTDAAAEAESAHLGEFLEDLNVEHIIGEQYGGIRPHSRHEHVSHPSVISVYNHRGIELIDFFTGRPLTHWMVEGRDPHSSVYVDIGSTGASIQQVRSNFELKCQAEATTLYPAGPRALFEGPLCDSPFPWGGGIDLSNLFHTTQAPTSENTLVAARPAVVRRVGKSRGMLNHLLGRGLSSERRGYDSLFLTSIGRLTSYAPDGQPNWQVVVPADWSEIAYRAEVEPMVVDIDSGLAYFKTFHPSITPLSLQLYAKQTAALVTGWKSVALVDLRDGALLGQHSLPCQVTDQPIIADFSRDGWTDFIITCPDGYVGFAIEPQSTVLYTVFISLLVLLAALLLLFFCSTHKS